MCLGLGFSDPSWGKANPQIHPHEMWLAGLNDDFIYSAERHNLQSKTTTTTIVPNLYHRISTSATKPIAKYDLIFQQT